VLGCSSIRYLGSLWDLGCSVFCSMVVGKQGCSVLVFQCCFLVVCSLFLCVFCLFFCNLLVVCRGDMRRRCLGFRMVWLGLGGWRMLGCIVVLFVVFFG